MTLTAQFLHGFGVRYDLPISLSLYLYAAAAVVVLSFVLVAVFATNTGEAAVTYARVRASRLDPLFNSRVIRVLGGVIGVAVLLAIVVCGLLGSSDPTRNPAEYLTWIYFWAGLVILSGLVGNLWALFNPFAALYALLAPGQRRQPRRLPARLGVWPAALLYLAFACLELTSGMANRPWFVAVLAVLYTGFQLVGMLLYGRDEWLSHFDAFTVLFSVIARFAPIEVERSDGHRRVFLRPWGAGLLRVDAGGWDWIVFVVLMLSTLAFDGILATPLWQSFMTTLQPALFPYGPLGNFVTRTVGLLLLTVIFMTAFTLFMQLVLRIARSRLDPVATMTAFVFTLVPIALVYNAAHNYYYLVVNAQNIVPALADPLGRGWHLFNVTGFQPSFALAGAAVVWYMQIILIVVGHVIAVFLAHLRAGERFRNASSALLSQYPMLLLMVLYTMTSLWILAQPITREIG
jgi:hypothetical protein